MSILITITVPLTQHNDRTIHAYENLNAAVPEATQQRKVTEVSNFNTGCLQI